MVKDISKNCEMIENIGCDTLTTLLEDTEYESMQL